MRGKSRRGRENLRYDLYLAIRTSPNLAGKDILNSCKIHGNPFPNAQPIRVGALCFTQMLYRKNKS